MPYYLTAAIRISCLALLAYLSSLTGWAQTPSFLTPADTAAQRLHFTRGGVRYQVLERGSGPLPIPGNRVAVRYTAYLPNGDAFDSTKPSEGPLRFRIGRGEVIPGWDELLLLLPVGSRVKAWIPAPLAYGEKGISAPEDDNRYIIPPNTELTFDLTVVSIR